MTNTPATTSRTIISLVKIGHLLTKQLNKSLVREFSLTFNQVFILFHVEHCPNQVSPKQLADRLVVSLPNVTAILQRLKNDHYLVQKQSNQDRRQHFLTLTIKGKRLLKRIQAAWPPSELRDIDETLRQLPLPQQRLLTKTLGELMVYLREQ